MAIARREFSRKDVLKMGLLGSAASLLPLERVARIQIAVADRLPTEEPPTGKASRARDFRARTS